MQGILLRTAITMLGLFLASRLVPGVLIEGTGTFILAALLLGFVNALVRPVVFLMTLPLTIVTAMFGLVAAFLDQFAVSGFWAAILGSLIVSLTSTIASWYVGPDGRYEILVIRRR